MTDNDINQRISQLRAEIAAAEGRIVEAEKNIRQLTALQKSCNNYQTEVGYSQSKRKIKREDFIGILNQDHLVDAYGYVLDDTLNGAVYGSAYQHVVTTVYIYNCLQELAGRTITPEECCKVNEIFRYCNITDRNSIACLLICCAGESYGLTKTLEDFVPEHGYEYEERGAGYIQVTKKDTQRACLQYIYGMYGIKETIEDQAGYAEEVAEYPWAASAWFWAILLRVGKNDKQSLNSYVMDRLEENGGTLTPGIVLTAECFIHGDVDPKYNICGDYTMDDALHVIARYDSLRLNDEENNGGWYIVVNENDNTDCTLYIPAEMLEIKENEDGTPASDIPSVWNTSEYLEFTAPL